MEASEEGNVCTQNEDLEELRDCQEISVWGVTQEKLEEQAQREIENFVAERGDSLLEEGEIEDEEALPGSSAQKQSETLDISSYIKRQVELKKRQDYRKSLQMNEHERNVPPAPPESKKSDGKREAAASSKHCESKRKKLKVEAEKKAGGADEDGSGSEYVPSEESDLDYEDGSTRSERRKEPHSILKKMKDDGAYDCYKARLDAYYKLLENECNEESNSSGEEYHVIGGELKIPLKTWTNLYGYQRKSVKWLWHLHQRCNGGLLGDEMGLGKTVQIIAFLDALRCSRIVSGRYDGLGPSLIICPATVLHQWVKHFHQWSPEFRVAILHQSGSFVGNKGKLIKEINKERGVLITTYVGALKYRQNLQDHSWHYLILDEGHKIRNPNAKISQAAKDIHTPHRILLTGSPMQNNLQELWSLFDFVNPGMLGTLPAFLEHFVGPIMQGGYANSTPMQEATALSTATVLKEMIEPFLLRRTKKDVQSCIALPNKSEQVLFCSLTEEQRGLYKAFLTGEHVESIIGKAKKQWFSDGQMRAKVLVAITTLRKICNHPDLYVNEFDSELDKSTNEDNPANYKRSGKMVVVSALLKIWKRQGHRSLLFTQGRVMMAVLEKFLTEHGYKYVKMDGCTSVSSRQPLIDEFNNDSSFDVFLLTTRVGGVGVNLTGADRVIIFDPDWNPATDTQARERAWRIGQDKQVTIYRLITAGTIEEKIYQRQVWKQLLSNKVLIDPKTQKFFKTSDLHDLFSLQEESETSNPETANIFKNSRINLQEKIKKMGTKKKPANVASDEITFSEDKIQAMKTLAQQIAKNFSQKKPEGEPESKTKYQRMLQEERGEKLKEKERLKALTPSELLYLNRKRAEKDDASDVNRIDGRETTFSFSEALDMSQSNTKSRDKTKKHGHETDVEVKQKSDVKIDRSGKIDGEVVEGLLKIEKKKKEKRKHGSEAQDEYILHKLFSKRGVQTALKHDAIVQCDSSQNSLKISTEANAKAAKALEELRKSRLHKWRW